MIVIDCNPAPEKSEALSNLSSKLDKVLRDTPFGRKDVRAYEAMIAQMERALSNKYYLLQNVMIEGAEKPLSNVLIGPVGIYLLNTNYLKGIFRAKEDTWAEMKGRNRQFEPVHPNLIKEALQMSSQLNDYLSSRLSQVPMIHPVLIMLNPGTHVDSVRPAVRTILIDGLERFIARLAQDPPQLTSEDVHAIVNRLKEPPADPSKSAVEEAQEDKNWRELQALKPVLAIEPTVTKNIDSLSGKLRFSTRQWIFLGAIGVINILLLITFLIIILLNT
jgi:hypothetical protein